MTSRHSDSVTAHKNNIKLIVKYVCINYFEQGNFLYKGAVKT